ncbi:L,D-transpeptidase family protein [Pseudoscardovia suis]|nr:L,D-transpeptidase family protein [Pseudoscardovia suis]
MNDESLNPSSLNPMENEEQPQPGDQPSFDAPQPGDWSFETTPLDVSYEAAPQAGSAKVIASDEADDDWTSADGGNPFLTLGNEQSSAPQSDAASAAVPTVSAAPITSAAPTAQIPAQTPVSQDFHSQSSVFANAAYPSVAPAQVADGGHEAGEQSAVKHRRHAWPWIVLAVIIVALAAAAALCVQHYQDRALPGVTLWGRSVAGETQQQIADDVTKLVTDTTVTVTYNDASEQVTLADLGYTVDANSIAEQAFNAKRSDNFIQRYLSSATVNVAPSLGDASSADPTKIGNDFGVQSTAATDATVSLNSDGTQYEATAATVGMGLSVTDAAQQLLDAIENPSATPQYVQLQVNDVQPAITDDIAKQAVDTLNNLIANPIKITGNGGDITTLGVDAINASYSVDPTDSTPDGSQRSGYVLFDAAKLQSYYETNIKANYQATEQDADVIVNNDGEVIKTNVQGHPGVTVADGGDSNVGTDAAKAMATGSGTVQINATVIPMQTKQTKRHTVVDLSDKKLYAYENDQVIKTLNIADGAGTAADGSCKGDLCTPTGDFKIWWKLDSQDMKGTLTLSDGSTTSWNAPGVKFVNYFSHSGCAIHRINSTSAINDADVPASGAESHGCIGLGWDVAEWYYNWADYNETVHIQQ